MYLSNMSVPRNLIFKYPNLTVTFSRTGEGTGLQLQFGLRVRDHGIWDYCLNNKEWKTIKTYNCTYSSTDATVW